MAGGYNGVSPARFQCATGSKSEVPIQVDLDGITAKTLEGALRGGSLVWLADRNGVYSRVLTARQIKKLPHLAKFLVACHEQFANRLI